MIKLLPVNSVPRKITKNSLQPFLDEFMEGEAEIVQILFGEKDYKSAKVCMGVWGVAVKRSKYPIKVTMRGDKVFLVKILEPFKTTDYMFSSKSEAESFLDNLRKVIEDYGYASVTDLCDLLGLTSEYSDTKQGWMDLSDVIISKVNGLYRVVLPKPQKV